MQEIKITRCPSWSKCSDILGEIGAYERGRIELEAHRLFSFAGMLRAVVHAKTMGAPMPKDWQKCHPSTPYQMEAWAEKIEAFDRIKFHNEPPIIVIEIPLRARNLARDFVAVPAQSTSRRRLRYVLYESGESVGEVWSKSAAENWCRQATIQ